MKVLKFLKSVGKDLLTFLIILAVFLATVGLIGFFITSIPTAISNIIVGAFFIIAIFIFVISIIDYLKKKWNEVK
jgi:FtsH-binding integral membrane protein